MKVVLLNGSPRKDGNTEMGLRHVAGSLQKEGIETEMISIGSRLIRGCLACGKCAELKNRECVFTKDDLNSILPKLFEADGLVVGSPVYYAGLNGTVKSFMDRAFYVAGANGGLMRHKVGTAIAIARRAGTVPAVDQMLKYFAISEMFIPTANYWNTLFGLGPGDSQQDEEGLQTMGILGANMAWLLKAVENTKKELPLPPAQPKIATHYIR